MSVEADMELAPSGLDRRPELLCRAGRTDSWLHQVGPHTMTIISNNMPVSVPRPEPAGVAASRRGGRPPPEWSLPHSAAVPAALPPVMQAGRFAGSEPETVAG